MSELAVGGGSEEDEETHRMRKMLSLCEETLARREAQISDMKVERMRTEGRMEEVKILLESAERRVQDMEEQAQRNEKLLVACREENEKLKEEEGRAREEREEVIKTLQAEHARRVEEAQRSLEVAEQGRVSLEAQREEYERRIRELEEDLATAEGKLKEAEGSSGGALAATEEVWRERKAEEDAAHRRQLELLRLANEEAARELEETFRTEREVLTARVLFLEQQTAELGAELEQRKEEAAATASEYEAAVDELEKELAHQRELLAAKGEVGAFKHTIEALHSVIASRGGGGGGGGGEEAINLITSMSRIIAQKEEEMEQIRESSDDTLGTLRSVIEKKDVENERYKRALKVFLLHSLK
eukprot:761180-Hanusia_phi.AAC.1